MSPDLVIRCFSLLLLGKVMYEPSDETRVGMTGVFYVTSLDQRCVFLSE